MDKSKTFTVGLWILLGVNYSLEFSELVNYFTILLFTIHLIEYMVFFKRIKNSGENLLPGLIHIIRVAIVIQNIERDLSKYYLKLITL